MSARELAELDNLLKPRIWEPLPGPQTLAYLSPADELFYGGAAGGGKTDLVLGLASTQHRRSIIFRAEYPQLMGIIDRSREIIGGRGKYNGSDHLWRLEDGRRIELAAVKRLSDANKFQGRPHDLKAFDEITHFAEAVYRFLNGWKRTTDPRQRTRTVCTGNPPTSADGYWVKQYWGPWLDPKHPNPAAPGELRWYAVIDGRDVEVAGPDPIEHEGETIQPTSRTFIPARVEDNPYYMTTGYKAQLQALPEPLRSQMLKGDFDAGTEDDPYQVIPTAWVLKAQQRWMERSAPEGPMTALGVDVARGGKDKTVLAPRWNNWFGELEKHPGSATPNGPAVAALVLPKLSEGGYANIDGIGVGASVFDHVAARTRHAYSIIFSAAAWGKDRTGTLDFTNLRAYAYWSLREALDPDNGDSIALPPDPELLADLCAPHWTLRTNGIQVEAKEDIQERLGRSTDCGDAVVLAALPQFKITEGPDIWS